MNRLQQMIAKAAFPTATDKHTALELAAQWSAPEAAASIQLAILNGDAKAGRPLWVEGRVFRNDDKAPEAASRKPVAYANPVILLPNEPGDEVEEWSARIQSHPDSSFSLPLYAVAPEAAASEAAVKQDGWHDESLPDHGLMPFSFIGLSEHAKEAAREYAEIYARRALAAAPTPTNVSDSGAEPMTDAQVEEFWGDANRGFFIERDDYFKAFRDAEKAHGIGASTTRKDEGKQP